MNEHPFSASHVTEVAFGRTKCVCLVFARSRTRMQFWWWSGE
jgi:hypothetical protein